MLVDVEVGSLAVLRLCRRTSCAAAELQRRAAGRTRKRATSYLHLIAGAKVFPVVYRLGLATLARIHEPLSARREAVSLLPNRER